VTEVCAWQLPSVPLRLRQGFVGGKAVSVKCGWVVMGQHCLSPDPGCLFCYSDSTGNHSYQTLDLATEIKLSDETCCASSQSILPCLTVLQLSIEKTH